MNTIDRGLHFLLSKHRPMARPMPRDAVMDEDIPILIKGVPSPVRGIILKLPKTVTIN